MLQDVVYHTGFMEYGGRVKPGIKIATKFSHRVELQYGKQQISYTHNYFMFKKCPPGPMKNTIQTESNEGIEQGKEILFKRKNINIIKVVLQCRGLLRLIR